jgi:hypothetical protein
MRYMHVNKDLSKWFGNDQLWYDQHNQRYAWFQTDPNYCQDVQKIFLFDGYDNIAEATHGVLEEA